MNKKISLIGIPLDLGAENLGVDVAPKALRDLKIIQKLQNVGLDIVDEGNIEINPREKLLIGNKKLKYAEEIIRVSEVAAKKVDEQIRLDKKVLAVGGDHSISLGTISGVSTALKGDLGIIYLDTHGDINTETSTLSGNIHGMHVSAVLGIGNEALTNVYEKGAKIKKENIILAGGNDFDLEEEKLIKKEKIKTFTLLDLLANGMSPLFKMINDLNKNVKNIWVSLDLDVIDYVYAPGVGIPNSGGITYREISAIAKFIGKNCNVVGMDLVEYNPLRDVDSKTADLSIELVAKIFGKDYSPYTKYMESNKI
ncbi:arginase [Patescibacteria group bacterium]|nr:arginase [Patescibacteria group bacterium]